MLSAQIFAYLAEIRVVWFSERKGPTEVHLLLVTE